MYSIIVAVGFLAASVLVSGRVSPRRLPLQKRFNVLSDQYATEQEGSNYLLSNNLWGMYSGSGSQTTQATSLSGNVIGWETTYSWANNPTSVKSYANVGLETGLGVTLASIGSIPTSWSWSYSSASSDLIADVSYDLWLSTDSSCGQAVGCSTYEIMVWLSKRGSCQPAGSYSKTVSIDGVSYDLWTGTVQNWNIFSFVISTETTDFNADLKSFFNYLTSSEGVSSAQFLTGVQAGTEPFTGSAKLLTSAYSVSVVQGSSSSTSSIPTSSGTQTSTSVPSSTSSSSSMVVSAPSSGTSCGAAWAQCGGTGFSGSTCCISGYTCTYSNPWYSQCLPGTATTTTSSTVSSSSTTSSSTSVLPSTSAAVSCGAAWAQCGGISFSGATCCVSGYTCTYSNDWYSQCIPGSAPTTTTSITTTSSSSSTSAPASSSSSVSSGTNYQTYTGALGGYSAPAVTTGRRGYVVAGDSSASFDTLAAALDRSCDNQHNTCANAANASGN